MLNRVLKRDKPRIYLGRLAVAPRKDYKRHLEEGGVFFKDDLAKDLRTSLEDIFSLPRVEENTSHNKKDLGIDMLILKYQGGDVWGVSLGEIGFPLFWRPKLEVIARLYYLESNKIKKEFSVVEKIKWSSFLKRLCTWRAFLRFRPLFGSKDLEPLLYQACYKLLLKVQKAV